jgi:hypothetical protein
VERLVLGLSISQSIPRSYVLLRRASVLVGGVLHLAPFRRGRNPV